MKTIVFLLMFLMFCMTANAETYFFVGSNFPVLSEETKDGNISGIGVDIAQIIGKKLGHTINISFFPWLRAQRMVKTGEADVIIALYKTPEREEWLDYTENYYFVEKTFFYVRPDSKIVWNGDFSSLQGKRIGKPLGWSSGPAFEKVEKSLSIDYAPTIDACFKKLMAERIDMIPAQVREAHAAFARLGFRGEQKPKAILPELQRNYIYFGFSKQKNLSVFKKKFDRLLKLMSESGEISQLLKEKYGMSDQD